MPKRFSKDKVYDENGIRRFHGAFTGGFSAGYYNTVGSEEGFTTTGFISSRNQRVEFKQYTKEDFMDEQDNRLVGGNLKTHNIFSESKPLSGPSSEGNAVSSSVKKATIVNSVVRNHKHHYGIGYVPIQGLHSNALLLNDDKNKVLRMGDVFNNTNVNSASFGISALEDADDMDVYTHTDFSQYDKEIDVSHHRIKDIEKEEDRHHRHHDEKESMIEGFVYSRKKEDGKCQATVYPAPHIPSHFHERHVFSKPLEWSWIISKGSCYMKCSLIEKLTSPPKKQNPQFTRMTEKLEEDLKARNDHASSYKYRFVDAGQAAQKTEVAPPTKVKSIHTVTEWRPAKLLCKRFNIRDPYKNLPDVESTPSKGVSTLEEMLPPSESVKKKKEPVVEMGEIMKEFSDPLQNVKKADIDLFDELFNV